MKTVVVTGGAGFVGSHLCKRLAEDGCRVISLDLRARNHHPGVEYRGGSTHDVETLVPETPDLMFHLGEYARVEASLGEPEVVWESNVAGTFAVLEHWRRRAYKLVYAGSSTKFGDGGLARVATMYAWTKAANTELVQNYGKWFGLPYAVSYFYNVYGPGERPASDFGTVIETFRRQRAAGCPLTVVSPGIQKRNFTHVADIVDGLVAVADRGAGDEYGLGAPESFSVLEVARMFGGQINMLPERAGNRMDATLDVTKSEAIGWRAKRRLADYIKEG